MFPCGGVIHAEGSAAVAGDDAGFCCPGYRVAVPGSGGHVRKGRGVGHGGRTAHAVQHRGQHSAGQGCLRGEGGVGSAGHQALFPAVFNGPGVPRISGNVGKASGLICGFLRTACRRLIRTRRAGGHGQEQADQDKTGRYPSFHSASFVSAGRHIALRPPARTIRWSSPLRGLQRRCG